MRGLVTVSNALVCAILDGIPVSTVEREQLLAHAGLSERVVRDITARTSIVRLARLWKRVLRVTGDDFIGLTIGTTVRGDRFGLGAHAAQHGEDFREVLVRFGKYATLVNDLLECRLDDTPPHARFIARLHWNVLGLERHAVDILFAAVRRWTREHLGEPLAVHELRVTHSLAAGERRYRELFGAPVVFGADRNELVFDRGSLGQPVRARDAELGLILDRFATLELSRIPVVTELPARITQLVQLQLEGGHSIELAVIAGLVAMPTRTLQRKLREHTTSFSSLVDDARRALAPLWLTAPDANVEQVGFRLGYSEPTAFIRAFKKWHGMTPGAFRRVKIGG